MEFCQKIDLSRPKYAEFYGDQFSVVQMIFYIAKKSIFINFIKKMRKNHIFYIISIFLKKRAEWLSLVDGGGADSKGSAWRAPSSQGPSRTLKNPQK